MMNADPPHRPCCAASLRMARSFRRCGISRLRTCLETPFGGVDVTMLMSTARLRRVWAARDRDSDETSDRAWNATLGLARELDLTLYDAAYLELAIRTGNPLASCDGQLLAAAARRRVEVLAA